MKEVLVRPERCLGCRACELACAVAHSTTKALYTAIGEPSLPRRRIYVEGVGSQSVPLTCRHCEDAPCVQVCISGAMQRDARNLVGHDDARCVGCWACLMVCPFGVIGRRAERRVAFKCDRCPDREVPACVEACPTRALVYTETADFARSRRQEVAAAVGGR